MKRFFILFSSSLKDNPEEASFITIALFVMHRWVEHPVLFAKTLFGVALATLADTLTPLVAGRLIGDVSLQLSLSHTTHDNFILKNCIFMILSLGGLGLISICGQRLSYNSISYLTIAIMKDVLKRIFGRVLRFSSNWHANNFAGATVRRLTRGVRAIDLFNDTFLLLICPEIVVMFATTAILAWRSPLMGGILFGSVFVFLFISIWLTIYYVAPSSQCANRMDTKMNAILSDSVSCNELVKLFTSEEREEKRLQIVMTTWSQRLLESWFKGTNSANIQSLFSLLMRIGMIASAVTLWWFHEMTAGDVGYVLTMMFLIQGYLRDIGQQISQIQRSINDMEEMVIIYHEVPDIVDKADAKDLIVSRGEITYKNVHFTYPTVEKALYNNFSVEIESQQKVALVGLSGSGKTTFIRLLQRFYDIQGGHIFIDGQDIAEVTLKSLRQQMTIVPQEPILFHRTIAENIAYGCPNASLSDIKKAAISANAHDFITSMPQKYDTLVGERGVKLSGGERQRLAIARAFLVKVPIIIFDEATASLDSESEVLVKDAMFNLMRMRTVFVVAHRLSTVREMDRILVFNKGKIVEDGTHASLMKKNGLYNKLVRLQDLK